MSLVLFLQQKKNKKLYIKYILIPFFISSFSQIIIMIKFSLSHSLTLFLSMKFWEKRKKYIIIIIIAAVIINIIKKCECFEIHMPQTRGLGCRSTSLFALGTILIFENKLFYCNSKTCQKYIFFGFYYMIENWIFGLGTYSPDREFAVISIVNEIILLYYNIYLKKIEPNIRKLDASLLLFIYISASILLFTHSLWLWFVL